MNLAPDDQRHGRYTTYTNHACRCDRCRSAMREWMETYRSTPVGRARTRVANRKSARRMYAAARWAYEHGYVDP
jgi:hypothetical protein